MQLCWGCGREFLPAELVQRGADHLCAECDSMSHIPCSVCDTIIEYEDAIATGGRYYCPICYSELYGHCYRCGQELLREAMHRHDNHSFCMSCLEQSYVDCARCGTTIHRLDQYIAPETDDSLCRDCFDEYCGVCDRCGDTHWRHNLSQTDCGTYCHNCQNEHDEWEAGEFTPSNPHFDVIGSRRRYGIELETSSCRDYRTLNGNTIWECKTDCSIEGREFVSPILYGDEGLMEIIAFCTIAHRKHWQVDRYCGYHAHFDVSNESWDSLKSIAYAYRKTYEMWCCLVSDRRANNSYCGSPDYALDDIRGINNASDWDYFVGARDRFEFINWRAYLVHGSCEVRSHDASLDGRIICNWVKLHTRFIDNVSAMTIEEIDDKFSGDVESQFAALEEFVGEELSLEYAGIAEDYGYTLRRRDIVALSPPF